MPLCHHVTPRGEKKGVGFLCDLDARTPTVQVALRTNFFDLETVRSLQLLASAGRAQRAGGPRGRGEQGRARTMLRAESSTCLAPCTVTRPE
jgi:hypothetical protein